MAMFDVIAPSIAFSVETTAAARRPATASENPVRPAAPPSR